MHTNQAAPLPPELRGPFGIKFDPSRRQAQAVCAGAYFANEGASWAFGKTEIRARVSAILTHVRIITIVARAGRIAFTELA